jgi:hypothetical protein
VTGLPRETARADFARERRRRALAGIAARLRFEPDDVSTMLPFEEVVAALGRRSQRDLGLRMIALDSIVGTVDRQRGEFDREFRPTADVRGRWERIATARRRGEEAHVIEVQTQLGADRGLRLRDLPLKRHERVFYERIPLPAAARARIQLSDEWRYAQLATLIEAWGYRASHERGYLMSRHEMARAWFEEEYEPVVRALDEAEVGGQGTDSERYLRTTMLRFLLLHTWSWNDDTVERLFDAMRGPGLPEDTMVNQFLKELR